PACNSRVRSIRVLDNRLQDGWSVATPIKQCPAIAVQIVSALVAAVARSVSGRNRFVAANRLSPRYQRGERQVVMTPIEGLRAQANKRPGALAFMSGNQSWSYGRVALEAERLAQALLAYGVRPGDRVALHMTNRPELVSAYYACFLTGAIAAPLNVRLKMPELRALLKRLRPVLYLGEAQLYPQVAAIQPEILAPSARFVAGEGADAGARHWRNLFGAAAGNVSFPNVDQNAPALFLTTAGSTGES